MLNKFLSIVSITGILLLAGCQKNPEPTSTLETLDSNADELALSSGTFSGRNDHVVTGSVKVVKIGEETFVVLDEEFTLDDAPDPQIGFGNAGAYDLETTFTKLENHKGAQRYKVPSTIDVNSYSEVYIWCNKFSVALGIAPIS